MRGGAAGTRAIVIGCGVIGITTALRLRGDGWRVEIWTRDEPDATTSAVAGAIWYPFLAEPRQRVARWSAATYERLRKLAATPSTGVRMGDVVEVFDHDDPDLWWADSVPDAHRLAAAELPPGYRAGVRASVPICDVPRHLAWLLAELRAADVEIVRRAVASLDEPLAHADLVVNCSGLGARQLCDDAELRPVRGQVLRVTGATVDAAWIDDTTPRPRYVIPRADDVVVGGTAQTDDERLAPDPAETAAILADAVRAMPQLRDATIEQVRVGLRPYRSTVRLERDDRDGKALVHNYGHGGSGYTVCWGCADEVASLARG
jgi:D-amino-acid oxidase